MRFLLDTSVLVAALVRDHPRHEVCLPWVQRSQSGRDELVLSAHSLAELHATLTRLPIRPRISPETTWRLVEANGFLSPPRGTTLVRSLSATEVEDVVEQAARRGLSGGILYDALIAKVAELERVEALVTLNIKHFRRVWPEGESQILEP